MPIQKSLLSSRRTMGSFIFPHLQSLTMLTKRFYYADHYASLPKTEARIKKKNDEEFILQSSTLLLIEKSTWLNRLFRWLTPKNWRTILIIRNDTLGYASINNPHAFNKYSPLATYEHPTKLIDPNVLYAIPQKTWDAFLDKLKHQILVDKLGLRKHRHLWATYSEHEKKIHEDRVIHAEWIGKYHFLISLKPLLDGSIYSLITHQRHSRRADVVFHYMDHGYGKKNPLDIIKTYSPALTPSFFKKTAHIPMVTEVLYLAELVSNYALTYPHEHSNHLRINSHQLQKAIDCLPSSKTPVDTAKTARMLDYVDGFNKAVSLNGGLFFAAKQDWQKTGAAQPTPVSLRPGPINDYFNALYQDLIAREVFNQLNKKNVDVAIHRRLNNKLNTLFLAMVSHFATYTQFNTLQERWHTNLPYIQDIKPKTETNPSWEALTHPQVINGVTITAITNDEALKNHGAKMQHCVGTYTTSCLNNGVDIFELTDAQDHYSTLEVRHNHNRYTSHQHTSYRNSQPSTEHLTAAAQFIEKLNNQTIFINPKRDLDTGRNERPRSCDYTDEVQEKIYAAYRKLKLLPDKLIAHDYQTFLKKINLQPLIENTLQIALQPEERKRDDKLDEINHSFERAGNCSIM